ncbi:DUF4426 domain-containing protein [Shewanella sp. NKUCC05_KAH]|jgi:hypothetical protein|uniref:DUF4426 domain-containing protein n=1 Tax=Shewanella oncorhynchi TaxID=2726434 RepID=A0AA50KG89_9GAMM|nr:MULTISPECIES: DUF4426 domain-containing protein [Shewanella]AVI67055.1 hypothetical protein CKQ84_14885 [Shewanella sp. WE21]MBI1674541.1 DUF4426 domain-containing protein [Shewanella sp. DW31]MBP7664653.1 DUF4426 domain-containing protein [Shewanella sp.]MBS0043332.1 DUF4426 domain-containing protein [Shewanella sp. M16]MBW3526373.1 DUF4426 domain-containing protein [Shewanella sp. NKUCC05_KAH]
MFRNLLAVLALTASLCGVANAEQKETVGNFDIHYMALGSTFLTPSIAKSYGIKRSNYTGIINIAVLDISEANKPAVPVEITGVANNLLDARINLTFKEIREGDAIYYIAEVPYRDDQEINFNIAIKYGNQLNTNLQFKQKFYVE